MGHEYAVERGAPNSRIESIDFQKGITLKIGHIQMVQRYGFPFKDYPYPKFTVDSLTQNPIDLLRKHL